MTNNASARTSKPSGRTIIGLSAALAIALSAYLLITISSAYSAVFASVWFLAILPAYLCAAIGYVGDPDLDRSVTYYWWLSPVFVGCIILGSAMFLREGVVCLAMLAPIWIAFGWLGAFALRARRKRAIDRNRIAVSLAFLPLLSGLVEHQMPVSSKTVTLTRAIVIEATPAEIWPFAVANASISPKEGRWTFTQNVLGLARPRATLLRGEGVGAVRTAFWGDHINFDEIITEWRPGESLAWVFSFTNDSLRDYMDRHISPDGHFLRIESGDYALTVLSATRTRLTLRTRYIAKTHVNFYAQIWGEIFLGDITSNVLTIIKDRAEARSHPPKLPG